ncbi:two-component sensor histidine kinase [Neptunitalea chrysea]|uniref:histidine kinase n=1 Tax=Neptunitalea chrysea TaxID=1647581 RepID=A0A9W6B6Q1_9FLAO|nr:HAMP domain-containing sensor histidine kinase [Neptunitalea chrysea]GLB53628.1 two-component sensor histidine kinase [Neptunitalea chrysea]
MILRFKTRIALHYLIATGIVIAIVFLVVFTIVKNTIYINLDNDLSFEAGVHMDELNKETLRFSNREEWEEREHTEAEVNPVFVQIIDSNDVIIDKSPNLHKDELTFDAERENNSHFNTFLENEIIRQVQVPVYVNNKVKGYILTAMSFEASQMVIEQLYTILLLSYPIILLGLFFTSRYLVGKSIQPIKQITKTTERINNNNLSERVSLPPHNDELYELSSSINSLLQRIEDTLQRERQFTSDASHELRTPLASLRGTLEIVSRKDRSVEEYKDKIDFSLQEIDRMSDMITQLLYLARFDYKEKSKEDKGDLIPLIDESIQRFNDLINKKELKIKFKADKHCCVQVPIYHATLVIDNIISNAIKYSNQKGTIIIELKSKGHQVSCIISDEGIGINKEDIDKLFNPFFRSAFLEHKNISGTGLGLAITKKALDAIHGKIHIKSKKGYGTKVEILLSIK